MSKVARKPVHIPENTKVSINNNEISVEGPLGKMSFTKENGISVSESDGKLNIKTEDNNLIAMSGTTRALVNNMVVGVTQGFETKLDLVGVGYRAQVQGKKLNLTLGFSHPVIYELPEGVSAETPSQTEVLLKSADKQKLGQAVAEIRAFRPPEPYKGKGVQISGEYIRRKEAKKK